MATREHRLPTEQKATHWSATIKASNRVRPISAYVCNISRNGLQLQLKTAQQLDQQSCIIRLQTKPCQITGEFKVCWQHQKTLAGYWLSLSTQNQINWLNLLITEHERSYTEILSSLQMLVHDLKSPLSNVLATNHMLQSGLLSPEQYQREGLPDVINRSCQTMQNIVTQVLDLKAALPTKPPILQEVNLSRLAESTFSSFKAKAQAKNIKYQLKTSDDDAIIVGDAHELERALTNMISNALKYARPQDRVTISSRRLKTKAVISIQDTGPGISLEMQSLVFEPGFKANQLPVDESSHGLGLAITKKIVEACGGKVRLSSAPHKGTTFKLEFPLAGMAQPLKSSDQSPSH